MRTLWSLLALFAAPVYAQTEPLAVYDTQLYCYDAATMSETNQALGEEPLFIGWASIDSTNADGEYARLEAPHILFVNQTTGTYISILVSPTGMLCSLAVGANFEPYGG